MSSLSQKRIIGQRLLTEALGLVPGSDTDVTTKDTWIFQIVLANITGGAVTVTVKDKQSTARAILQTVSIAANSTYVIAFPEGVLMTSGFSWAASAADSIVGSVVAFRRE